MKKDNKGLQKMYIMLQYNMKVVKYVFLKVKGKGR